MKLSKNVSNKKCLHKLMILNEKIQKDSDDFLKLQMIKNALSKRIQTHFVFGL